MFSIVDFGAKGDGEAKNTESFRLAIAACNDAGGGTVLVPPGKWVTGAIHLKSNVNLHLDEGAEIHFSDDPEDYLPVVFTRCAGLELMNYSPLIYASHCENIAITGPGRLFGHGKKWWRWVKPEAQTARRIYEEQVLKDIPPEKRICGTPECAMRPQFINPIHCTNVLFEGFTIAGGGPFWTFDITYCDHVIVRGLTINTQGGPNNDGVNFDSTRNGLLEYCEINSEDDCCGLKSGLNEDGWRVGRPTENIVIRHVRGLASSTGGVVCGSEMSGGVRNIYVYDCEFLGNKRALWIKSNPSRGGIVENIWFENIRLHNVQYYGLYIDANYGAYMASKNGTAFPTFRNISYKDITVDGVQIPADISNIYKPIDGVTMENVTITGAMTNMLLNHIHGLTLKNVTCNGLEDRTIAIKNCTAVVRSDAGLPKVLEGYDPSGQIRFRTPAEADAKRQELIHFIWSTGLPTNTLPSVITNIGAEVFAGDLKDLNGKLAASVDRLDDNVSGWGFHSIAYLIHPKATNENTTRLVIAHQGHQGRLVDGIGDALDRLLQSGFTVLAMQMPLVGWNTSNTIDLPNGTGRVTITNRATAGHTEIFRKLTPVLTKGECFRFFLEPVVQGINYFQRTTPAAGDISMFGLSGGGWTTHMAPAVDTRIQQSFPVAGAYPGYILELLRAGSPDTEQSYAPMYIEFVHHNTNSIPDTAAGVASKLEIFALGGYGKGRRQIQILNLHDSCCFYGPYYTTYTNFVSTIVRNLGQGQWDFYSDTTHRQHLVSSNVLENVIIPALLAKPAVAEQTARTTLDAPDEIAPIIAPFPMSQLKRPVFPGRIFNIEDYGAQGDGTFKNTESFRQAIAACNAAGGGMVFVPSGKWLTGAIHLKSHVNLHLDAGAEIHFSDDPNDYLPVVFTRWGGVEVMNYSPLIYANGCENIAVTGPGKLFGHGEKWWPWFKQLDEKGTIGPKLQTLAVTGIRPGERLFGNPAVGLRPQFINPVNCRNVLLEGFTIAAPGPHWTIDLVYCEKVIARKLTILAKGGPNNDGIDLDSTRNVLVEHCLFDVSDDAVCLKSGLNEDGRRVGRPTENVVVRNVETLHTHGGIVIGSEMSGDVRNMLAYDCDFNGSDRGIRLKSNPSRGGIVENIYYRNINMHRILDEAIVLECNYAAWGAAQNQTNYPTFRNINLTDIICDGADQAVSLRGNSNKPIENVHFNHVIVTHAKKGMVFENVNGLTLENVACNESNTPANSIR